MERQLRLAERRGLLNGRALSPIAEAGLEVLVYLDGRDKAAQEIDVVKAALVGHDPSNLRKLYPQWFSDSQPDENFDRVVTDGTPEADDARANDSYVEDYSEVEWVTPGTPEFEEMMRLAEAVADAESVTVHQGQGGEWF